MKKRFLISGFEPFKDDPVNPSEELAKQLEKDGEKNISVVILPVVYSKAADIMKKRIEEERPDFAILFGLAAGRSAVSIEKRARNIRKSKTADNEGNIYGGESIEAGGPDMLSTPLDAEAIADVLKGKGIAAEASEDAGSFVCNDLFYSLISFTKDTKTKALFVHLPHSDRSAGKDTDPFMSEEEIMLAAKYILEYLDKE